MAGYLRRQGEFLISQRDDLPARVARSAPGRQPARADAWGTQAAGVNATDATTAGAAWQASGTSANDPPSSKPVSRRVHWEIDTVLGTTRDCVVTLVERQTGYLLVGKMRARTTAELNRATFELMCRHPAQFRTITADNGEFHDYRALEEVTGVPFYFATPHHSWERGTNENTNGLLRQYLPKGTSLAALTQSRCDAIAQTLNTPTPKKTCLPNTRNVLQCCTTKLMSRFLTGITCRKLPTAMHCAAKLAALRCLLRRRVRAA